VWESAPIVSIPGATIPLLRQEDVFDANTAYFKIMSDMVLSGKIPDDFCQPCRFNIFIRREMIRNQGDPVCIEYGLSNFFKGGNGRWCRNIIGQYHIETAVDEVTRLDGCDAGVGCQNFL
jgi:hypothetical protein